MFAFQLVRDPHLTRRARKSPHVSAQSLAHVRLFFALSLAPDPLLVRLWGGDFTFGDDCFACSSDSSLGASADAFLVSFADRGDSPVKPYLVIELWAQ